MKRHSENIKRAEVMVAMRHISSREQYTQPDGALRRVLADINLRIRRGEVWGITGRDVWDIRLLLEIMGNIRPYDNGRCVLAERGMMRRKRVIQPHVFYIGSTGMLYDNMNVLEFLMFATAWMNDDRLTTQEEIFEYLIEIGLGRISLTPVRRLTRAEKAVITLLAAVYSDSGMIIWNLPNCELDAALTDAVAAISAMGAAKDKALIIGTASDTLIEKSCSHTAFIAGGRVIFQGTVDYLRRYFDKAVVIVRDKHIDEIKKMLTPLLSEYVLGVRDGCLRVSGRDDASFIYRKILAAGVVPDCMQVNPKSVKNAYEEIARRNDL